MIICAIVTTVLNSRTVIAKCIESVRNQTMPCLHIIVDGGSTDGTREYLAQQAISSANLEIIDAPKAGIAAGFNVGVSAALQHTNISIVSILNGDDWLEPNAVKLSCATLSMHTEADFTYGSIIIYNANTTLKFTPYMDPERNAGKYMPFPHISSFVRRSVYEKYGLYDCSYKIAMDMEFYARVCSQQVKGIEIKSVIGNALGGGNSSNFFPRARENIRITTKYCGVTTALAVFIWFGLRVFIYNTLSPFPRILRLLPTRRFMPIITKGA